MFKKAQVEPKTDTRSRILAVSERLFAEKGYDSTGIDEIAKKAGIAKSVIYYHFKNKEEILNTMIENFFREAMELKMQRGSEVFQGTSASLKDLFREGISYSERRKWIVRILFMEQIKKSPLTPLFDLWERNFLNIRKWFGDKATEWAKKHWEELKIELFFTFYLPWIGYLVFGESLADYYHMDKEEIAKIFTGSMTEYLQKLGLPKIWRDLPEIWKKL
ncbi:MAG: hypothetical protein DRP87_14725 [Spirochaetes bacterium]|nr:MAG: hypothetical protein DRP87_14725 [Spirochaetota bacterium]